MKKESDFTLLEGVSAFLGFILNNTILNLYVDVSEYNLDFKGMFIYVLGLIVFLVVIPMSYYYIVKYFFVFLKFCLKPILRWILK